VSHLTDQLEKAFVLRRHTSVEREIQDELIEEVAKLERKVASLQTTVDGCNPFAVAVQERKLRAAEEKIVSLQDEVKRLTNCIKGWQRDNAKLRDHIENLRENATILHTARRFVQHVRSFNWWSLG